MPPPLVFLIPDDYFGPVFFYLDSRTVLTFSLTLLVTQSVYPKMES